MSTVLCHGTFDLLHLGHLKHLEAAKALGDRLIVSVTADAFVKKGPGRPVFPAETRAAMLRALRCVDEVCITEHRTAVPVIERLKPDLYIKGKDWEERLTDRDLIDETVAVTANGGRLVFLGEVLNSSSALWNRLQPRDPALQQFLTSVGRGPTSFRLAVKDLQRLKVCVFGDPILDRYHTVTMQGLTAKASVPSARHVASETHEGGVLAVVRHLTAFTPHVRYLPTVQSAVVKERFVNHPTGDQPLTKYFAVMQDHDAIPALLPESEVMDALYWADLCVVADFGHGAMSRPLRDTIIRHAKFLAVNCQTNSANYGFNVLPTKYWRADMVALDRTELDLAIGERGTDHAVALKTLAAQLRTTSAFLTRGDVDTLAYGETGAMVCPALDVQPVDTLGAGDAFFSVVALMCAAGHSTATALLAGQVAGAQMVRVVGNRTGLDAQKLIEHGCQLLAR